jgi:hypothetical protein
MPRYTASLMILVSVLLAGCGSAPEDSLDFEELQSEVVASSDARAKAAITSAANGLWFMSESDHAFTWVSSASKASAPASAAFVHRTFNATTNSDPMADKPLSTLKSETVPFESFAARFVPVRGEDPELLAYHTKMTRLMGALRTNLKNPVVLRFGRKNGSGLVGAISVYVIGTLPSGKIGGVFTVAVET